MISHGRISQRALPQLSPGVETTFARRVGLWRCKSTAIAEEDDKLSELSSHVSNLYLLFDTKFDKMNADIDLRAAAGGGRGYDIPFWGGCHLPAEAGTTTLITLFIFKKKDGLVPSKCRGRTKMVITTQISGGCVQVTADIR